MRFMAEKFDKTQGHVQPRAVMRGCCCTLWVWCHLPAPGH